MKGEWEFRSTMCYPQLLSDIAHQMLLINRYKVLLKGAYFTAFSLTKAVGSEPCQLTLNSHPLIANSHSLIPKKSKTVE